MLEGLSKTEVTKDESDMWGVEKDWKAEVDLERIRRSDQDKRSLDGCIKKEYNKAEPQAKYLRWVKTVEMDWRNLIQK